jgi:hypothetical protein
MNSTCFSMGLYVFVSLLVILVLILKPVNCPTKDNFCNCYGNGNMRCPSTMKLSSLYNEGKLTENTARGERPWPTNDPWIGAHNLPQERSWSTNDPWIGAHPPLG